jgi:hypothetical protein
VATVTAQAEQPTPSRAPLLRRLATSPLSAGIILLLAFLGLSMLMDPMGGLGTDTGGKVATLEVMADRPLGLDPDLGYWAAAQDPDASLHGLFYTEGIGDRFINVTTLPMLELAAPLYRVGGYRLALVLPMAGAIVAAFAARALAARLGAGSGRAWGAYWLVGLASPMCIYALDLWEHTWGVALLAWGVVALLRVRSATSPMPIVWGGLAGLAFGAAYSMRTEALAYGFVATAVICISLLISRQVLRALLAGGGAVAGLAVAFAANLALEHVALGQSLRAERASGTAGSGGADLALRIKEAFVTAVGLVPSLEQRDIVLGAVLAAALIIAARASRSPQTRTLALAAGAVAVGLLLYRVVQGLGFVPGLVATTPLAALGVAFLPRTLRGREVYAIALGALPVVWYFQYSGGAVPQWAGRYILPSGLLLLVLGVVNFDRVPRAAVNAFVAASVAVTVFGLAWMVDRTHEIGEAAREVAAFPEPALVAETNFFLRELGAEYHGSQTRWLSTVGRADTPAAVDIVRAQGLDQFAFLTTAAGAPPEFEGFEVAGERAYDWLGVPWRVVTYDRTDGA